jgi:hypothetical protein
MKNPNKYLLNLDLQSSHAFLKLIELDTTFIGTTNYMGIAFFWNKKYDFILGCSKIDLEIMKELHSIFLLKNLDLDGTSKMHNKIIKYLIKKYCTSDVFNQVMRCFEFYNLEV